MDAIPLWVLVTALFLLIVFSGFFSSSETGMMALNRYRLRHLARQGHPGAVRATALLERPDRLLGLILLGNNLVNIVAGTLATVIALRVLGDTGVLLAPFILTPLVLIFAEVAPKTVAAVHPERIAFPAAFVLKPMLRGVYPVVAGINWLANGLVRLAGVRPEDAEGQELSSEELRTVVNEAGAVISRRHQRMLVSILDLEKVTVDDIMVPRAEINGLDLDDDLDELIDQITHSLHTRLPVYRSDIDNLYGVLHLRRLVRAWEDDISKELLGDRVDEPYFVPSGTPLHTQLRNFQQRQERMAFIVDEYGDIEGLVTLEDLLEEIVGEFTTDPAEHAATDVHPQEDGSFVVDGATTVRELNRAMGWTLPTDGPRTVNGLVLEYLEAIPEPGTSLLIGGHPVEILHATPNTVRSVRMKPRLAGRARRSA